MAKTKGFGGLLVGALLGAAAALLLTPKRGEEWRDELKNKGEKLRGQAENLGAKVSTEGAPPASDLFAAVKEKGAEWIGEAGEHFNDLKNSAAQKVGEVKNEASGKARVVSAEVSDAGEDAGENLKS